VIGVNPEDHHCDSRRQADEWEISNGEGYVSLRPLVRLARTLLIDVHFNNASFGDNTSMSPEDSTGDIDAPEDDSGTGFHVAPIKPEHASRRKLARELFQSRQRRAPKRPSDGHDSQAKRVRKISD
jgi:hypothetical protein